MTDGDLEKTLQNALEKMGKYLNASKEYFDQLNTTQHTNEKNLKQYLQASEKHDEHMNGDLEKTLQNALEKMGKYLNASKEYFDQLNTTQHTNKENLEQYLQASAKYDEQLNKMKKFELNAIEANMKYKNNSDDIQNFEEYKNVSQKLFHEIGYLVDLEGELLYRNIQYLKGLSKEKRRETNLDYYKRVADYYSGIFLV
uniref:SJCHGC02646 protein n=1 Tax=Schistosoma japonicum TaxID=6182 RepID=Q5DF03_SCHJA|nr:SJCHGC02646 protein [Schistosoma japonicum]